MNASTAVHPCQEKAEICSSKTTRSCVSSVVMRMRNGDEGNSDEGKTRILKLQKEERSAAEEEGSFGGGFDYDCERDVEGCECGCGDGWAVCAKSTTFDLVLGSETGFILKRGIFPASLQCDMSGEWFIAMLCREPDTV
ncbi:hypothetical protein FA15DRAFT_365952 [Coprinopsis marcescibilis]|uniref:Uncharacterized protein n=1 Tax=Coprinopsis marcescibilis TaxID=230819 RepID=A0A5C3KAC3_COPMA|nr:hypothetical protein FA15DRAFT_365952 [Coprinopsis marcescibilis]